MIWKTITETTKQNKTHSYEEKKIQPSTSDRWQLQNNKASYFV